MKRLFWTDIIAVISFLWICSFALYVFLKYTGYAND